MAERGAAGAHLPLAGLRILLTRPRGAACQLLRGFEQQGATAVHVPCLAIRALQPRRDAEAWREGEGILANLARYHYGIFVSANAVRHLARRLQRRKQSWPPRTRVYAVGEATAATAQGLGLAARAPPGAASSEALLEMAALRRPRGARAVIFRGYGGRALLGDTLRRRGLQVHYCALYHREAPAHHATLRRVLAGGIDIITVASGITLEYLLWMAADTPAEGMRKIPLVVPGRRLADYAARLGFHTVIPAQSAAAQQLVDAVLSWRRRQR